VGVTVPRPPTRARCCIGGEPRELADKPRPHMRISIPLASSQCFWLLQSADSAGGGSFWWSAQYGGQQASVTGQAKVSQAFVELKLANIRDLCACQVPWGIPIRCIGTRVAIEAAAAFHSGCSTSLGSHVHFSNRSVSQNRPLSPERREIPGTMP
jgi:hypothetical protein